MATVDPERFDTFATMYLSAEVEINSNKNVRCCNCFCDLSQFDLIPNFCPDCGKALTSRATELTAERLQVFEMFCERADHA